jgi:hypothetical protein
MIDRLLPLCMAPGNVRPFRIAFSDQPTAQVGSCASSCCNPVGAALEVGAVVGCDMAKLVAKKKKGITEMCMIGESVLLSDELTLKQGLSSRSKSRPSSVA